MASRPPSQKRLKSSQSSRSQRSLPPAAGSRAHTPASRGQLSTAQSQRSSKLDVEPLGPGRVQSPFSDLRPVAVAPLLPPMVPHAWAGDPDDPAFKPPSFETIGKPIRLKFCKEWYEDLFGAAAKSIPDILDASNWLPADAPVRLKLPGKLKEKLGIQDPEATPPTSRPSTASTVGGHRKEKKRRQSQWQVQAITEVAADERHWAAVRLQCKMRSWSALRKAGLRRRQRQAQVRIASRFRGHLVRTGRCDLVKKNGKTQEHDQLPYALADRLQNLDPWCEELDLRHHYLGQGGTIHLKPFMLHLHSLQMLQLCGNYMGSKGLACLAKSLDSQRDLKYLGLAWNGLGDESSVHLAKILRNHSRLQHVDLRHNRLGDAACLGLARATKGHAALEQLDLQDNAIASAGAEALYAACGRRLTIHIEANPVPMSKIEELKKALKEARAQSALGAAGSRGGTPGSAKSTLRAPSSRGKGGHKSPARSPARSRASSGMPAASDIGDG
mmetsp:Transcript_33596/g.77521  ORF Transcript_33596/g.77521 Transcript_33596/m.77521 type:complete len:500 (+) Transcript_33596:81-1580(+)